MKYLIQYPIHTQLCNHEGYSDKWFKFRETQIRLVLKETTIFTKSKKIQVITEGNNYSEAAKKVINVFLDFFDLLTFFSKQRIEIDLPELYLRSEPNKLRRKMIFHLYEIDYDSPFWNDYQNYFEKFLMLELEEIDKKIMYYLRRAIEAHHIYDKYLNVFKVIESIVTHNENDFRKCPKCNIDLICPECQAKAQFKRLNKQNIKKAVEKFSTWSSHNYDYKTMLNYRNWCSHPVDRSKINSKKASEIAFNLFVDIDSYYRQKYNIEFMFNDIGQKQGMSKGIWSVTYKTRYPENDFALDVPLKDQLDDPNIGEPVDWAKF